MGVRFVYGDLLKARDVDVIVHQVNCLCVRAHGLSKQIANSFPWADIYSTRQGEGSKNLVVLEDRGISGTIRIFESAKPLQPDVVCFLSQWDFGTTDQNYRNIPPYKDTRQNRLIWFRQCLEQLSFLNIKSVAIPYRIGCGLGGGDWTKYFNIIKDFSKTTDIHFVIYTPSLFAK